MKKFSIIFLFLMIIALVKAEEKIEKSEIKTSAVCEHCKEIIEGRLSKVEGIKSSSLDLEKNIINVEYDTNVISLQEIKEIISNTGYDADEVKKSKRAFKKLPKCCQVHEKH